LDQNACPVAELRPKLENLFVERGINISNREKFEKAIYVGEEIDVS
jgi:hypothetical protein